MAYVINVVVVTAKSKPYIRGYDGGSLEYGGRTENTLIIENLGGGTIDYQPDGSPPPPMGFDPPPPNNMSDYSPSSDGGFTGDGEENTGQTGYLPPSFSSIYSINSTSGTEGFVDVQANVRFNEKVLAETRWVPKDETGRMWNMGYSGTIDGVATLLFDSSVKKFGESALRLGVL